MTTAWVVQRDYGDGEDVAGVFPTEPEAIRYVVKYLTAKENAYDTLLVREWSGDRAGDPVEYTMRGGVVVRRHRVDDGLGRRKWSEPSVVSFPADADVSVDAFDEWVAGREALPEGE